MKTRTLIAMLMIVILAASCASEKGFYKGCATNNPHFFYPNHGGTR